VNPSGRRITLEESYARCKALNRQAGTTYFWATQVLPTVKRHHVHALYAFCRYADDIVDGLGPVPMAAREAALIEFGDRFFVDLDKGRSDDPILRAVVHTALAFALEPSLFRRFLRSMRMDLTVERYETWADLCDYMDGSAAVIGEMMLPLLEPTSDAALQPARDLGLAFQLTNFLRDVGEDLDRGRVYLPQEDVRRFGADPTQRRVTPEWVALMRFEIDRNRELYVSADRGLALLPDSTRPAIVAARRLYGGILDQVEGNGYDVFSTRARIPTWRKVGAAAVSSAALARARIRAGTTGASIP
jgi:phytoene synthase